MLRYDGSNGSEYFDGSEEHIDLFMGTLESLRIDLDHLLG